MLRVDDVLGSEVAVAERGDLRRRQVAARRLELLPRSHPRPGDGNIATASSSPDPALLYK